MVSKSAIEDVMLEHAYLNSILTSYEEIICRLLAKHDLADQGGNDKLFIMIQELAGVLHRFIEKYHEQTEEKYIFPELLQKNVHTELINDLIIQHRISRLLTKKIYSLAKNKKDVGKLISYIKMFVRMYRFHENKEDTIIFQEFRKGLSEEKYKEMSQLFEEEEHTIIGPDGFKKERDTILEFRKNLIFSN